MFETANNPVAKAYFHSKGAMAIQLFPNNRVIAVSGNSEQHKTITDAMVAM